MKKMSLELKPEYIVDKTGKKIKVILDISRFEDVVEKLEDFYFGLMSEKAIKEKEEFVDWQEAKKTLFK
jgi:hypothetical protein